MSAEARREIGELLAEQLPPDEPFDVDTLMPTDYLLIEVLAARHRTGEQMWTLPSHAVKRPRLDRLASLGLIGWKHGVIQDTVLAWLTDEGKRACFDESFVSPVEAQRDQARSMAARLWDELAQAEHDCEQLRGRAETAEAELKSALAALSEQQQEERP